MSSVNNSVNIGALAIGALAKNQLRLTLSTVVDAISGAVFAAWVHRIAKLAAHLFSEVGRGVDLAALSRDSPTLLHMAQLLHSANVDLSDIMSFRSRLTAMLMKEAAICIKRIGHCPPGRARLQTKKWWTRKS
jgi:hypothetical protein